MSIFEDVVKMALSAAVGGNQSQSQASGLVGGAMNLLDSMGGVQGLVNKLQQSGLGDVANSWIGKGENKSISAEDIKNVLSEEQIAAVAQQSGIPLEKSAGALAGVLPSLIDKLTPDGNIQHASELATIGKVLLGGIGAAVAAKAAVSYFHHEDDAAPEVDTGAEVSAPAQTQAAPEAMAQTYTVVSGDSLSKIAKHFYSNANQWERIFEANRHLLNDPDRIQPGQVLNIP